VRERERERERESGRERKWERKGKCERVKVRERERVHTCGINSRRSATRGGGGSEARDGGRDMASDADHIFSEEQLFTRGPTLQTQHTSAYVTDKVVFLDELEPLH
jgi:hypothetical protein